MQDLGTLVRQAIEQHAEDHKKSKALKEQGEQILAFAKTLPPLFPKDDKELGVAKSSTGLALISAASTALANEYWAIWQGNVSIGKYIERITEALAASLEVQITDEAVKAFKQLAVREEKGEDVGESISL